MKLKKSRNLSVVPWYSESICYILFIFEILKYFHTKRSTYFHTSNRPFMLALQMSESHFSLVSLTLSISFLDRKWKQSFMIVKQFKLIFWVLTIMAAKIKILKYFLLKVGQKICVYLLLKVLKNIGLCIFLVWKIIEN